MKALTLLEAFNTMLNGSNVKLSDDTFEQVMEDFPEISINEFTIQCIERDGEIALYSQECSNVIYDLDVCDVYLID